MTDTRRWSVRRVPGEVVTGFRRVAVESNCSISELLQEAFHLWWDQCVVEEDDVDETEEQLQDGG